MIAQGGQLVVSRLKCSGWVGMSMQFTVDFAVSKLHLLIKIIASRKTPGSAGEAAEV
jgi:hypothetical protein